MSGFEAIALTHWILLPFGIISPVKWFAEIELALFHIFSYLASIVVLLVLYFWVLKPLVRPYFKMAEKFVRSRIINGSGLNGTKVKLHPWVLLSLSLFIALVGAIIPYTPNINPKGTPVGVDVDYYVNWMIPVEKDPLAAFTVANGSRPVLLLLIYTFQRSFGLEHMEAIKYIPILLNPLLAISVFFMTLQATDDKELAGLASVFTASGFTTTVGMFSHFITNILGQIFIFTAIGFLFKAIQTRKNSAYLLIASALGSFAVFTHPWTFIQYYVALGGYLLYRYFILKQSEGKDIILIYLGVTRLVDLIKGVFLKGLEGLGSIALTATQLTNISLFWNNSIFIYTVKYGGLLSNIIILSLAAIGAFSLINKKSFNLFLSSVLTTSSLYYLMADEEVMSRLIYNIPLGVLAASGTLLLLRKNPLFFSSPRQKRIPLFSFTIIYMINYALRSLSNII